jgi:hypothetical protein
MNFTGSTLRLELNSFMKYGKVLPELIEINRNYLTFKLRSNVVVYLNQK